MRIARSLFLLMWIAAPAATQVQLGMSSIVAHDPLTCMSTGDFPIIEAELDHAQLSVLRQAQVYFKASQTQAWYFVDMEPGEGARLRATLPKPLAETERVDYYLFFLSTSFEPAQSQLFSARVAETGCGSLARAEPSSSLSLVLRATVGNQPPVPPGFSPQGISSFVTAAGNTVTVGAAAGASSGLPAAAIGAIAGGGAAVVVGGVLVAGGNGTDGSGNASPTEAGSTTSGGTTPGSSPSSPSPTPTNPTPSPSPSPAPSILDVSGTWDVSDRIIESCLPGTVGQTSSSTMTIQQNDTHLTVTLRGMNFSANMMGTIDASGKIAMSGQFTDEGEAGQVDVDATTTTGSDMRGSHTQFYPDHNCSVRGTFSGAKR